MTRFEGGNIIAFPMATFGENLKREREMRGVSLEEISASTKISVRFLKALENEDFGQLPGGIFTRSFIRAYAGYLGLDEDHIMAEFHLLVPAEGETDLSRMATSRPLPRKGSSRGPLAVLVAALLLGSGYLLYIFTRVPTEIKPPSPVVAPGSEASATDAIPAISPAEAATAPGQGQPPPGTSRTPSTRMALPVVPHMLSLQIAATEDSWVAVDADGRMVLQRILAPGEIETLQAKESFDVTTGNALGVVLTLNGETLKPLGRRGEVKTLHLTANDARKTSP